MLGLLLVIAGRLVVIQGFDPEDLASAAAEMRTKSSVLPAERGKILDANGTVLADSIVLYDIVGDPSENTANATFRRAGPDGQTVDVDRQTGLDELAAILGLQQKDVHDLLTRDAKFAYVARSVDPAMERRIIELNIPKVA